MWLAPEYQNPLLKGLVGTAPLPGSTVIWDRDAQTFKSCTPPTFGVSPCPHAKWQHLLNGSVMLVNRAPYFGYGGFAGAPGVWCV